jgi:hypothetical protein
MVILSGSLFSETVNGYLEIYEEHKVLRVKGTIEERGYAQGFLVGEDLRELMTGYLLPMLYGNNAYVYSQARSFFEANFEIEQKYINESQAIINGMIDSGTDLYISLLNREIDHVDLLMNSSIVDLIAVFSYLGNYVGACSSLSSWGESTNDLPDVSGEQIITRHLDWSNNAVLRSHQMITVHFPAEAEQQKWINIGITGFMGALSAINESRLGAFYNVGSNHNYTIEEQFQPILLALRNALETLDYNEDGDNNYQDIQAHLEESNFISGSIIHTAALMDDNSYPVVFEVNNMNGCSLRTAANNNLNPPVAGDHLAATNHFRTLYAPTYCYRYQGIADSLQVSTDITPERSWKLLSGAAGVTTNLQAMQYIPVTGELKWATTLHQITPAHSKTPVVFDIDYLLTYDENQSSGEQDTLVPESSLSLCNYPNPFNPETNISFTLEKPSETEIRIFNIRGELVHNADLGNLPAGSHNFIWRVEPSGETSSGIYIVKLKTADRINYHKMLLMK